MVKILIKLVKTKVLDKKIQSNTLFKYKNINFLFNIRCLLPNPLRGLEELSEETDRSRQRIYFILFRP